MLSIEYMSKMYNPWISLGRGLPIKLQVSDYKFALYIRNEWIKTSLKTETLSPPQKAFYEKRSFLYFLTLRWVLHIIFGFNIKYSYFKIYFLHTDKIKASLKNSTACCWEETQEGRGSKNELSVTYIGPPPHNIHNHYVQQTGTNKNNGKISMA